MPQALTQPVTLTDVAKAAGVSYVTVSRVLNSKTDYRRPTFAKRADKIRRLARDMGYRPNAAARATVTGRFDSIGLLLSTHHSRSILPEAVLNAIADAISDKGLRLSISKLPDEKLVNEGVVPDLLREWSVDGLLINYNAEIPQKMAELIDAYGLPAVWLNSKQPHDCVYPDDEQAGRIATEHLLELGHTRIAFVHYGGWGHYSAPARRDGYAKTMRAAGLTPQIVAEPDMDSAAKRRTAGALLRQPDRPTAVIVYSVATVWPLHLAAVLDVGLKVPDDLSIVSFDVVAMRHADVHVSVARLPCASLADRAVTMLVERIADRAVTHDPVCLPCRMEQGNTTAVPPRVVNSG